MVISHRKKFIYFVVPKCASATIRQSISIYTDIGYPVTPHTQHMPINHFLSTPYAKENANLMSSYFKFSFVRNPYDRLYSGYIQDKLASETMPEWTKAKKPIFDNIGDNFNRYIREYVNKNDIKNDPSWICFCPMYDFSHVNNDYYLDWFGRVENIESDLPKLSELIGFEFKTTSNMNVNVKPSRKLKYLDKYESSTIEIINTLYKDDFNFFNYEMLDPNNFPCSI